MRLKFVGSREPLPKYITAMWIPGSGRNFLERLETVMLAAIPMMHCGKDKYLMEFSKSCGYLELGGDIFIWSYASVGKRFWISFVLDVVTRIQKLIYMYTLFLETRGICY